LLHSFVLSISFSARHFSLSWPKRTSNVAFIGGVYLRARKRRPTSGSRYGRGSCGSGIGLFLDPNVRQEYNGHQ
jgi:hypothetical protein